GASKGEGLGNKFLAHIRECQAICHVVRAFKNDDIVRADNKPEDDIMKQAKDDIDIINLELQLADEETKAKIEAKRKKDPNDENVPYLTDKPVIYMFNVDEQGLTDKELQNKLKAMVRENCSFVSICDNGSKIASSTHNDKPTRSDEQKNNFANQPECIFVNAKLEEEMSGMNREERKEFLESYGVEDDALGELIKAAYETLGLQSFLTAGKKECRAWTIKKGATAPEAAGTIHTDFERGFIAASICNYEDLKALGSEKAVKEAGKLRTEGKTYIMKDGDVVEFKFNV
ncbi:DUF933 domain-containing protein, partial [Candidatus Saccharibacteria bacterium]|nr:DUF933 domain-containing protein [Candidatus Saccharibacteria bacterium]